MIRFHMIRRKHYSRCFDSVHSHMRPKTTPSLPQVSIKSIIVFLTVTYHTTPLHTFPQQEERELCEQIVENARVQALQVEMERKESRPITVHEWAVAAGHPSAHQLMAALQEGRKAQRTVVLCHQGLVRSVAYR